MTSTGPGASSVAGSPIEPAVPRIRRLVGVTSILIDVSVTVPRLPSRGGDVIAAPAGRGPGGGINTLVAAARLGMPTVYGGALGTGPNASSIREALARNHIGVLSQADCGSDTGWCLTMIEPDGERTFVTAPGAEARLSVADLRALQPHLLSTDAVYLSGYDLAYEVSGYTLAAWLATLLPHQDGGPYVVLDPGPLIADVTLDRVKAALSRADLLSATAPELGALESLAPGTVRPETVVIRRYGVAPVELRWHDQTRTRHTIVAPTYPPPSPIVDTSGAGDTHLGALLAVLTAGKDWTTALVTANQAAAWSISRPGAAAGPTGAELDAMASGMRS